MDNQIRIFAPDNRYEDEEIIDDDDILEEDTHPEYRVNPWFDPWIDIGGEG